MKDSSQLLKELLQAATREYHEANDEFITNFSNDSSFQAFKEASHLLAIVEAMTYDVLNVEVK